MACVIGAALRAPRLRRRRSVAGLAAFAVHASRAARVRYACGWNTPTGSRVPASPTWSWSTCRRRSRRSCSRRHWRGWKDAWAGAATAASGKCSPNTSPSAAPGGARFDPTDFKLVLRQDGRRSGPVADRWSLATCNSPRSCRWRRVCRCPSAGGTSSRATTPAARSPRASCSGRATPPRRQSYVASARFTDLGIDAQDGLPGFSGLSGSFDATEKGGALHPAEPGDAQSTCRGCSRSRSRSTACKVASAGSATATAVAVTLAGLAFANAQIAGTASGTYQTASRGPGHASSSTCSFLTPTCATSIATCR